MAHPGLFSYLFFFYHFVPISGTFDKIQRDLNFCGKIITSLASNFTIENSLFKTIFGHKILICQPNSTMFAAPVAKSFVLNTDIKFVCHFSK